MCNLLTSYAVAVQLLLGLSIVLVLVVEYLIERCRKDMPRTFVQFWFDSFKLCSGALVTHGYNVLCAMILNSSSTEVDECAVYMIAFYYEATGITLVQMLTYGVTKYSRRKYLEIYHSNHRKTTMCSNIFYWISYPGHYTFREQPLESARKLLSDTDSDLDQANNTSNTQQQYGATNADQTGSINDVANTAQNRNNHRTQSNEDTEARMMEQLGDVMNPADYKDIDYDGHNQMIGNITFLHTRLASTRNKILCASFSIIGAVIVGVLSYYILDYHSVWIDVMMAIFALMMFATLSVATAPVIWQTVSWILIKVVERSLWTLFVYSQKQSFIEYSNMIAFGDDVWEAVLFIAVIPMIIGCIMFWMFSNIARMNIPFIDVKKFASDVMARFNLKEALKVGVYSTLLYNSILWLPAELAILTWESAGMLFLMMVIVPAVANAICVLILYLLLTDMDNKNRSFLYVENRTNDARQQPQQQPAETLLTTSNENDAITNDI